MLTSLISLLGGGLLRMLPEVLGFFGKKADNSHELAMLNAQVELEKVKAAGAKEVVIQQGAIDQVLKTMDTYKEALSDQMKATGIRFVDALNALVRPLTTYYFLVLFGLYKAALLGVALQSTDLWHAILAVYSVDDADMFAGILSFWFVGRVFDKNNA